jgi:predicted transcriptional regulator
MKQFLLLLVCLLSITANSQNTIGKTLQNISIKDVNNKSCSIPYWGEKILVIFYTDPDAKDVNEPLSTALKNRKYPLEKYQGVGISNSKDSWIPNSIIYYVAKEKQKKYPNSIILIDDNHTISNAWTLNNTDNSGYVIIIGKDKRVKFIRMIKNQDESKLIIKEVLRIIDEEIK